MYLVTAAKCYCDDGWLGTSMTNAVSCSGHLLDLGSCPFPPAYNRFHNSAGVQLGDRNEMRAAGIFQRPT